MLFIILSNSYQHYLSAVYNLRTSLHCSVHTVFDNALQCRVPTECNAALQSSPCVYSTTLHCRVHSVYTVQHCTAEFTLCILYNTALQSSPCVHCTTLHCTQNIFPLSGCDYPEEKLDCGTVCHILI